MMPSGQRVYVGGASLIAKNKVSDEEEDDVNDIGEIRDEKYGNHNPGLTTIPFQRC